MEENSYLPNYGDDDVFSFGSNTQSVMFRVRQFRNAVQKTFQEDQRLADALSEFLKSEGVLIDTGGTWIHKTFYNNNFIWFRDGIDCEVLRLGSQGWQKGKVRIRVSLEFCPDEPETEEIPASNEPGVSKPESPLDDLRQMMNQENQQ